MSQKEGGSGGSVSKGLARACESVIPTPKTPQITPKGCAEGAPQVPDRGGVPEGGACPPLHLDWRHAVLAVGRGLRPGRVRAEPRDQLVAQLLRLDHVVDDQVGGEL